MTKKSSLLHRHWRARQCPESALTDGKEQVFGYLKSSIMSKAPSLARRPVFQGPLALALVRRGRPVQARFDGRQFRPAGSRCQLSPTATAPWSEPSPGRLVFRRAGLPVEITRDRRVERGARCRGTTAGWYGLEPQAHRPRPAMQMKAGQTSGKRCLCATTTAPTPTICQRRSR
jgi:hypothetical protein